jgi:tetratricopeptide (TPR) repeat protein
MFRQVIAILPDSWRGYSNLGGELYVQDKSDEAIAAFEKSWSLRPNYLAASNLGTLYYFQKGDFPRAASAFKRALSQDDRQFVVWGNYGAALHWSGDEVGAKAAYTKAIALAEEARNTNPRNGRTLMTLAGYYGSLHETDRARDLMEQALALDPENSAVLYEAGELCESELHDRDRALALLERALIGGYQWNELERSPSLAALRKDPRFAGLRSRHANAKGA